MTGITVYTTGAAACVRVLNLLEARGFRYTAVPVETEADRAALVARTGRATCPAVFVGDKLLGGVAETIDAERSGRLAQLVDAA